MSTSDNVRIGIIGGSGLGEALLEQLPTTDPDTHMLVTPFGATSAPIVTAEIAGVPAALLQRHGDGHIHNPAAVPYRANIYALKSLGCTHIVASGATGSLREEIAPGDVVICDQLIDKTDGRPRTFYDNAAVHVEFADPFCEVMRRWLIDAGRRVDGVTLHDRATYVCMEGPSFSTRAESHMHRAWGADLVGMTACPEARLAREAEMAYALIGLPTDYDCWRPRPEGADAMDLLTEIIGNLQAATAGCLRVLTEALRDISALRDTRSAAHDALALGIWTNKSHIDQDELERLRVLWGRHIRD